MEVGDSIVMFQNVPPDSQCMFSLAVKCAVHKFHLRNLVFQEKVQFLFYQIQTAEAHGFVNG